MKFTTASFIATAILATYSVGVVEAFWRLPCRGVAGLGRLDPIVQPGGPSDHAHLIFGGSGESSFHPNDVTSTPTLVTLSTSCLSPSAC